ncbi:MAG TPA: winged helix-turn-helix domain-containing protein [Terracidiphilus sp.]|jgi:DNA-binding winged helix-turn-helix (wHTH) protein/tetratricopeptide (TPR) repeat protein
MIYRFGIFEVDTAAGELRRKGLVARIQDQPFRVLTALLDAQGRTLSKEDLRAQVWSSDIHVELDGALSVAVAKLREALGDNATNPRFIETVPRRGYRFIAVVETIDAARNADPAQAVNAATLPVEQRLDDGPRRRMGALRNFAAAGVLVLLGVFATYIWMRMKAGERPVHSLIVADFVNTTGDSVFDGSLRQAAIVQLSQSPWLHVESDRAIDDALQGLGRLPAQGHLTPEMARQACQPLQVDAVLSGSISRHGTDNYLISLDGHRCGDGQRLSHAATEIKGRDQVLGTLGRMLVGVRQDLGESGDTRQRFNVPIEQATTDSLEALNAYRVGYDLRSRGRSRESIPYFKAAIVLDPQFAMAYEQLGSVYTNMGEEKTGASYVQKAFDLRGRTTEPERYFISGRYFDVVTVELEKAISIYRLWHDTYPREWTPANALANDLNLVGRYPEAIAAAQEAVRLEPNHSFGYTNLAVALLAENRYAEAQQICSDAIAKNRVSSVLGRVDFQLAFAGGDPKRIQAAAQGMEKDVDNSFTLAEAKLGEGKVKEAKRLFAGSASLAHNNGLPGIEATDLGGEAIDLALIGEKEEALRLARESVSADAGELGYAQPMVVLAMFGSPQEVADIGLKMDRAYPLSEYNIGIFWPQANGFLARRRGETAEQILKTMAPAVSYELGQEAVLLPVYIRGTTLAEAGDGAKAAQEFQRLLDHRGVDPTSPLVPLAHLGLARAHYLAHQARESCIEYREFLREWDHADPSVPILQAARSESAARCILR